MIPGSTGELIVEWARRAETGPFSSLGVLDRPAYQSFDPFVTLGAAAPVTERLRLVTMIVIGPIRPTALLAQQAGSIHALSGGRLTLGLSIGARLEDYEVLGIDHRRRGDRLSDQLEALRDLWEDGSVSPAAGGPTGPPLLVGGGSGVAFARMARYGDGYVHGGGPPRAFAGAASRAWAAWSDAGRPGAPQLWGQGYFALGEEARDPGADYLRDYYAFTGPFAEKVAAANPPSPRAVVEFIRGYEDAGCDELILFPTVARIEQLERLADVVARAQP
jgi:alkanesulfonate monooxygenase SsuD/methylene tetrahydromethanopterin reductase-like flavin-dependent oxidoreductase (luciferase family)